jgi:hypothetical protein
MTSSVRCHIESASVRAQQVDALRALIQQLFNRRHLSYIAPSERAWLTAELVQSLRRQSEVYRSMSSKTSGPLPFALGYFRVAHGELEPVSDSLPLEDPRTLVRLLSEYLEPGASLTFYAEAGAETWAIRGVDEVERVKTASTSDPTGDAPIE